MWSNGYVNLTSCYIDGLNIDAGRAELIKYLAALQIQVNANNAGQTTNTQQILGFVATGMFVLGYTGDTAGVFGDACRLDGPSLHFSECRVLAFYCRHFQSVIFLFCFR